MNATLESGDRFRSHQSEGLRLGTKRPRESDGSDEGGSHVAYVTESDAYVSAGETVNVFAVEDDTSIYPKHLVQFEEQLKTPRLTPAPEPDTPAIYSEHMIGLEKRIRRSRARDDDDTVVVPPRLFAQARQRDGTEDATVYPSLMVEIERLSSADTHRNGAESDGERTATPRQTPRATPSSVTRSRRKQLRSSPNPRGKGLVVAHTEDDSRSSPRDPDETIEIAEEQDVTLRFDDDDMTEPLQEKTESQEDITYQENTASLEDYEDSTLRVDESADQDATLRVDESADQDATLRIEENDLTLLVELQHEPVSDGVNAEGSFTLQPATSVLPALEATHDSSSTQEVMGIDSAASPAMLQTSLSSAGHTPIAHMHAADPAQNNREPVPIRPDSTESNSSDTISTSQDSTQPPTPRPQSPSPHSTTEDDTIYPDAIIRIERQEQRNRPLAEDETSVYPDVMLRMEQEQSPNDLPKIQAKEDTPRRASSVIVEIPSSGGRLPFISEEPFTRPTMTPRRILRPVDATPVMRARAVRSPEKKSATQTKFHPYTTHDAASQPFTPGRPGATRVLLGSARRVERGTVSTQPSKAARVEAGTQPDKSLPGDANKPPSKAARAEAGAQPTKAGSKETASQPSRGVAASRAPTNSSAPIASAVPSLMTKEPFVFKGLAAPTVASVARKVPARQLRIPETAAAGPATKTKLTTEPADETRPTKRLRATKIGGVSTTSQGTTSSALRKPDLGRPATTSAIPKPSQLPRPTFTSRSGAIPTAAPRVRTKVLPPSGGEAKTKDAPAPQPPTTSSIINKQSRLLSRTIAKPVRGALEPPAPRPALTVVSSHNSKLASLPPVPPVKPQRPLEAKKAENIFGRKPVAPPPQPLAERSMLSPEAALPLPLSSSGASESDAPATSSPLKAQTVESSPPPLIPRGTLFARDAKNKSVAFSSDSFSDEASDLTTAVSRLRARRGVVTPVVGTPLAQPFVPARDNSESGEDSGEQQSGPVRKSTRAMGRKAPSIPAKEADVETVAASTQTTVAYSAITYGQSSLELTQAELNKLTTANTRLNAKHFNKIKQHKVLVDGRRPASPPLAKCEYRTVLQLSSDEEVDGERRTSVPAGSSKRKPKAGQKRVQFNRIVSLSDEQPANNPTPMGGKSILRPRRENTTIDPFGNLTNVSPLPCKPAEVRVTLHVYDDDEDSEIDDDFVEIKKKKRKNKKKKNT